MLRPGGLAGNTLAVFLQGVPLIGKRYAERAGQPGEATITTIPYGVAIGIAAIAIVTFSWWTGNEEWFHSFVTGAASR